MSRKKKIQLRTVLIYCEWATEVVCAKYFLHTVARWRNKKLTIKDGRWWSPLELVNKAIADMEWFDEVYIWTDIDRPEINNALSLANDKSISVIKNNSNLEEEILRHLWVICGQIEDAKKKYRGLYTRMMILWSQKHMTRFFEGYSQSSVINHHFLRYSKLWNNLV